MARRATLECLTGPGARQVHVLDAAAAVQLRLGEVGPGEPPVPGAASPYPRVFEEEALFWIEAGGRVPVNVTSPKGGAGVGWLAGDTGPRRQLQDGDVIEIGPHRFRFRLRDDETGRARLRSRMRLVKSQEAAAPAAAPDVASRATTSPYDMVTVPELAYLQAPLSPAANAFRRLRELLVRGGQEHPAPRTVLVTGATAGEGKSFTAINLSLAVASSVDMSAVLIDADLHRPSMHGYFGVAPSPGLSDYLRAVADVDEISWPTMLPKLMLVPAGTPAHDAMELLTSQRMSELLRLMKEEDPRRLIVVDAAPLMQATEVATLARYVDGVLLVVTENLSRVSVVQKAAHLIAKEQMLGVVYNRSSSKAVEAPYGSYYYGPSGSYVRDTLAANTDGKQS